jgi:hypothetical protein
MALSLHETSVPALKRSLRALCAILGKASEYAASRKIDPGVLLNARLYPDMFPLVRQVQIASDLAKGCAARLGKIDIPSYADDETSFAALQQRIGRTIDFIDSVDAAAIDASEDSAIVLKLREREVTFTGKTYLLAWVLPNFYFHAATAYDILRHNGLEIGKKDFLGE